MQKIDIGIVSNCRSFRVALDTMLKEESAGDVHCLWDDIEPVAVADKPDTALSRPQLIILDLDYTRVPIAKLLQLVRAKYRHVKLLLLVGRKELNVKSLIQYQVDKVMKRSCSAVELLAAVQNCVPAPAAP